MFRGLETGSTTANSREREESVRADKPTIFNNA